VRPMILKPLAPHVGELPWVSGITMLASGHPAVILDVEHLFLETTRVAKGGASMVANAGGATAVEPPEGGLARTEKQLTVLVVDDSLSARMMEKGMLEEGGFRVVLATDGEEGLGKLGQGGIDLILTDVEMPRMNGLEMVAQVRSQAGTSEIPIVMVSSLGSEQDRKRGLDVGADAYLVKGSLTQESLVTAVNRLVGEPE